MSKRCAALIVFGFAASAFAAAIETPEHGYREAYRLVREAKMADYNGNADLAAWKWGEAKMLLEKISREYPAWNHDVVLGHLGEAMQRLQKTAPSPAKAFEISVEETRGLAGSIAEFDGAKVSMLKQMEWEKKKLSEIEKLARDLARKENARRILGLEEGATIALADMRRAEAGEPTPDPELQKEAEKTAKGEAAALDSDSDSDGLTDGEELELGTDPEDSDTDGDGLTDGDEVNQYETDPLDIDTDGDGWEDGEEVELGFDPLDPDDPGYDPS
ncbi:MAG: hypothetical protein WCP22_01430 [Chlamydiota bacterium]